MRQLRHGLNMEANNVPEALRTRLAKKLMEEYAKHPPRALRPLLCLKRQDDLGAILPLSEPQVEATCLSTELRELAKTSPSSLHKNCSIRSTVSVCSVIDVHLL